MKYSEVLKLTKSGRIPQIFLNAAREKRSVDLVGEARGVSRKTLVQKSILYLSAALAMGLFLFAAINMILERDYLFAALVNLFFLAILSSIPFILGFWIASSIDDDISFAERHTWAFATNIEEFTGWIRDESTLTRERKSWNLFEATDDEIRAVARKILVDKATNSIFSSRRIADLVVEEDLSPYDHLTILETAGRCASDFNGCYGTLLSLGAVSEDRRFFFDRAKEEIDQRIRQAHGS